MIGIGSDKKHCRHFHYHQLTCPPGQLYTSETISSASAPRSLQTLLHGRPNVSSPTGTSPAFRNVVACQKQRSTFVFMLHKKPKKNCELKIETSGRLGSDSTASYVQGRNSAWQPSAQTVFGAAASRISYQPKDLIWRILWLMYLKCAHLETRGLNHYDWKEWVQLSNFDTLYQKIPSEMEVAPRYNCWNCWHC